MHAEDGKVQLCRAEPSALKLEHMADGLQYHLIDQAEAIEVSGAGNDEKEKEELERIRRERKEKEAAGDRVYWNGYEIKQEDLDTVEIAGQMVNDEALNTHVSICAEQTWKSKKVKVFFVDSQQWQAVVEQRLCGRLRWKDKAYPEGICKHVPVMIWKFDVVLVACNWSNPQALDSAEVGQSGHALPVDPSGFSGMHSQRTSV